MYLPVAANSLASGHSDHQSDTRAVAAPLHRIAVRRRRRPVPRTQPGPLAIGISVRGHGSHHEAIQLGREPWVRKTPVG